MTQVKEVSFSAVETLAAGVQSPTLSRDPEPELPVVRSKMEAYVM